MWIEGQVYRIIIIAFFLLGVTGFVQAEDNKTWSGEGDESRLKPGDQSMMNAVFLATGPGLVLPDDGKTGSVIFYSADENADGTDISLLDIFENSYTMLDTGLYTSCGIPGFDSPYCVDYASVCPGTYTYDENGVRIEQSGGGDVEYREYCCGNYPWTPIYAGSES